MPGKRPPQKSPPQVPANLPTAISDRKRRQSKKALLNNHRRKPLTTKDLDHCNLALVTRVSNQDRLD